MEKKDSSCLGKLFVTGRIVYRLKSFLKFIPLPTGNCFSYRKPCQRECYVRRISFMSDLQHLGPLVLLDGVPGSGVGFGPNNWRGRIKVCSSTCHITRTGGTHRQTIEVPGRSSEHTSDDTIASNEVFSHHVCWAMRPMQRRGTYIGIASTAYQFLIKPLRNDMLTFCSLEMREGIKRLDSATATDVVPFFSHGVSLSGLGTFELTT
jgi:hypothetical protein